MNSMLVECVPNISEGRVTERVDAVERAIVESPGSVLLHRTSDYDHNRSVLTFVAPPGDVVEAAVRAVGKAAELIDLREHVGVHPRVGSLDVLPLIPLGQMKLSGCVALAHAAGARIWNELGIPVYFYEAAALRPYRSRLEDVRRGGFETLREAALRDEARVPDVGGPGLHPSAGAVIVGARNFLIAFNINLKSVEVGVAKAIAQKIRASSGGLPGVKAMGVPLGSRGMAQVSMNITDFEAAPLQVVYGEVERLAAAHGVEVEESELIGLIPQRAIDMGMAHALRLKDFGAHRVIETRLESALQKQKGQDRN